MSLTETLILSFHVMVHLLESYMNIVVKLVLFSHSKISICSNKSLLLYQIFGFFAYVGDHLIPFFAFIRKAKDQKKVLNTLK